MLLNGLIMDIITVFLSSLDVMTSLVGHSLAIISFILRRYGTLVLLVIDTLRNIALHSLNSHSKTLSVEIKSSLMVSLMPKEELFQLDGQP